MSTVQIVAETAMGTKLELVTKKEIGYKEAVCGIGKIKLYRILNPWFIFSFINVFSPWYLHERRLTNTLHTFTKEVITEREKNFENLDLPKDEDHVYKGKKRLAMLDLLLSAKKTDGAIDNQGIREEVDTFMFEGHDTTAVALGFILMLLACHKDVQVKRRLLWTCLKPQVLGVGGARNQTGARRQEADLQQPPRTEVRGALHQGESQVVPERPLHRKDSRRGCRHPLGVLATKRDHRLHTHLRHPPQSRNLSRSRTI